MEKVRKLLLAEVCLSAFIVLAIVILFESNVLAAGGWPSDKNSAQYVILQFCMQLLTISVIPLSLYFFKYKFVQNELKAGGDRSVSALRKWGTVRLLLLLIPLVLNTLFYYLFGFSVSFFYLALILVLGLTFVFPTRQRCFHDISSDEAMKKSGEKENMK